MRTVSIVVISAHKILVKNLLSKVKKDKQTEKKILVERTNVCHGRKTKISQKLFLILGWQMQERTS